MKKIKEPKHKEPHKYFQTKFKQSGTIIFRCAFAGCPHFLYEPFMLGKVGMCFRCSAPFVITGKSLKAKKLHCEDCTRLRYNKVKPKVVIASNILEADIDNILSSLENQIEDEEGNPYGESI